ncbi:MAG: YigZ family protein, partial [Candidatus Methanomethylophilaceae archaeon]|nr:YigZ family protein [Candidatus Methanomethylophilaceae archaeon]
MAFSDYSSLEGEHASESSVKGSKFIGISMSCPDEASVSANLSRAASMYPQATHYCYAAVFGGPDPVERFSDNGEPSGTAGRPILGVLRGSGLSDAMIVVVRYFGGTLLGTGGLVKAYTASAEAALEGARVVVRRACAEFSLSLDYASFNSFQSRFSDILAARPECEFSERVLVKARVPVQKADEFSERVVSMTGGKVRAFR